MGHSFPKEIQGASNKATFPLIYRMKVVKDYEYQNYVCNLRRATTFGEFGSDSIKIILDSLVAVTGSAGTKAALRAASAGIPTVRDFFRIGLALCETMSQKRRAQLG